MANEEIRDKKDLQAQINEGLREQNNLTQQYATLLQAQKSSSKDITDDIEKTKKQLLQEEKNVKDK